MCYFGFTFIALICSVNLFANTKSIILNLYSQFDYSIKYKKVNAIFQNFVKYADTI